MKIKSKVLIIAGSDSSGGAGIQADIKTVTSLGSYAMTAITAVTSQNTTGVKSIVSITPKEISSQIDFSVKDIRPNAVKIGMLHSKQIIQNVIRSLNKIRVKKIVLDPVMVAKGGARLVNNAAIIFIKKKLMKNTLLITPNIPEAEILSKMKINSTALKPVRFAILILSIGSLVSANIMVRLAENFSIEFNSLGIIEFRVV